MADGLPLSTRLVLRDHGGADSETVVLAAIGDLVADGAWRHDRGRRRLVSRVDVLTPVRPPTVACEPLATVDRLLHRAVAATGSHDVRELARWIARHAGAAPAAAVQHGVDWLVEHGFLEQATATFGLGGGVPHAWSGEQSIKELRPTESGKRHLRDLPPRERRGRKGAADVESPETLTALGFAHPVSLALAGVWCGGFAVGTHENAVAHHHGGVGVVGGGDASGGYMHHGHHG